MHDGDAAATEAKKPPVSGIKYLYSVLYTSRFVQVNNFSYSLCFSIVSCKCSPFTNMFASYYGTSIEAQFCLHVSIKP